MQSSIRLRITRGALLAAAVALIATQVRLAAAQPLPPGVEPPRPGEQIIQIVAKDSKVTLTELQTRILELGNKIRSVDGHDPDILTIIPVSNQRIRVKAEKSGVTSFTLTDEFDNVYTVEVFVDADVRQLQAYLGRLFPGSSIEVVGLNGSVVLRGWVTEPTQIPMIIDVAEKFAPSVLNQMSVGGVSQVQLQVKVMEVQRSKLRQLGFNFQFVGADGSSFSINPATIANPTVQFAITDNGDTFRTFIEAVETNALARVLADTAVVTNSGRPAQILAGGQFPIPVPQQLGTVTVEYRDFGVRLEALPIVLGNGRLRLQVAPEVSERDVSSAVIINGSSVPGITLRRVNTEVEMRFGETLMLGGLILQRQVETRTKIPFLGDLPLIGSAFARRRSEVGETELLIMVTPNVAAPMIAGQLPIAGPGANTEPPESREFYVDGFMEVPAYNPPPVSLNGASDPALIPPSSIMSPGFPGEVPFAPPSMPATEPSPATSADAKVEGKKESGVTPTSGIFEPRGRERSTTIGTMKSFRTGRKPASASASVKSNAGDDVSANGPGGHSNESAATGRKIELIEPSTDRSRSTLGGLPARR
jgi:pilus assembly protein CpaC